ncbi:MAG: YihY/virulence factor BrkB family protein [Cyclobacteriaceae bacterium]
MRHRRVLHKHLRYSSWYVNLINFLKNVPLAGGKTNLHKVLLIFTDKVGDNQLWEKAYGVAFNFTLSIFPAVIFLFALIPFVHTYIPSISQGEILHFLQDVLPETVFQVTAETIFDTIAIQRQGLISFGVLFALFLATNGVNSLMLTFNMSYKTVDGRSFIKTRFIALLLTLLLAFALLLGILFLIVGQIVVDWFLEIGVLSEDYLYYSITFLRILVVFIVFYLAIASIYFWGPAIHDRWRFFSVGATFSTLVCILVSLGFSFYVANFGTYNKVYGSIGAIIALMVWQWMMSFVLLLGFEFNASVSRSVNGEEPDNSTKENK